MTIDYEHECWLYGFEDVECGGKIDNHHLLNRAKLPKDSRVRLYCEQEFSNIFLVPVCSFHNSLKWADTKKARRLLVKKLSKLYGIEYVRDVIDGIPWKVKHHELTYKGIMAAPLPER